VNRHEIKTKWQLQQLIEEKGLRKLLKVLKNRGTFYFGLDSLNLGGELEEKSSRAQWPCQESVDFDLIDRF
jgi:hypothetical protein